MSDPKDAPPLAALAEMQHWTGVVGRAQQMMMEHAAKAMLDAQTKVPADPAAVATSWPGMAMFGDPAKLAQAQVDMWTQGLSIWQRALSGEPLGGGEIAAKADQDKRFSAPQWRDNPVFDTIRQSYIMVSDALLGSVEAIEGVDAKQRERLRFATRAFVDAMSPSNFALTNPQVLEKTMATKGENLLKGLEHMLADMAKGQLTHTDPDAFEVGRNIATTPGKVVAADAALPADPICAGHRQGVRDAAGDLPAVDQPLLHPRSQREEELHPLGGGAGPDRLRRVVEVGRREPRRHRDGRLCARAGRGDRHGARPARRRGGPRDRLLRRRHHAGGDLGLARRARARPTRSPARPSSPRRSISPRPATSTCSSATSRCS